MSTVDKRHFVGIAEAADRLGVDPRTIRRRISEGTLPAYRLGGRLVRIDVAEVEKLLVPIPTVENDGAA